MLLRSRTVRVGGVAVQILTVLRIKREAGLDAYAARGPAGVILRDLAPAAGIGLRGGMAAKAAEQCEEEYPG